MKTKAKTKVEAKLTPAKKPKRIPNRVLTDILAAMRTVYAHAEKKGYGKGNGGLGECKCPLCPKGTLRYSVAGLNGHIHAACTTKGCVRWMQ